MRIASLALFVAVMWAMILAVAAFLVLFVAPIDAHLFDSEGSPAAVSIAQAAIAFAVVAGLVFGLSRMKKIYLQKKLRQ
ncbi:MAG TPA: hypothetical protein VLA68_06420 [Nitrososphaera sp.]|nr:hypothetical protein [Nitrososphaera sp.]